MSVYVVPYSVTFLKFVPALIAVLVLAAAILAFRASQRWLMTKPLHRREASNWLSATALGLFVLFIFLISLLSMPARAEAKPVKQQPQKTQRVIRDVTPLFAAADTQQFSARKKRYAVKRYAKRWRHRAATRYAGADLNVMTPTERAEYYQSGGQQSYEPATWSRHPRRSYADANGAVVGGRYPGDPWRFCGAEAVRYVYGVAASARRDLWLAANWIRKFNRTSPAPGMAAARPGHVMVLISQVSGLDWLVHDGNSGGGLTRKHVRSIAGYVVVDPHSPRSAAANGATHEYSAHGRYASTAR